MTYQDEHRDETPLWVQRRVSRGRLLRGAAAAGAGLSAASLLAACGSSASGSSSSGGSTEVIYSSWGGTWQQAMQKAWFTPFENATGIKVTVTGPPDYGKIEAMVQANATEWDVAEIGPDFQWIGAQKGVLTPIDWNAVKKSNFVTGNPLLYTNNSVPQVLWASVITWRKDKIPTAPTTWADLWDTRRFPGKRTFDASTLDDGSLEAALLADGVAPKDLYPLNVDRALAKFDQIKSDILWFQSGSQMIQYFQSGEASIGFGWDGRIAILRSTGVPVDYTYDHSLSQWTDMVVPKGAPHADAAMKLLAYITQAQPQAHVAEASYYGPINPKAFQYIPTKMQSELSGTPASLKTAVPIDWKWWSANYDSTYAKFTSWLNS